jgi:hypothetical protein
VQYHITAECGNTPYSSKGYYHDRLCGAIARELFCNNGKTSNEASTPTCGGDTFGMELTKSGRFGSAGLNLTSEGLLLRGEPSHPSGGYPQRPHQSGFLIPNTPDHTEGILIMSCRKPKVSWAFTWRLRRVDDAEAHVTTWAEARRRRWRANHQPKVGVPM